jgi:hypothetical protein
MATAAPDNITSTTDRVHAGRRHLTADAISDVRDGVSALEPKLDNIRGMVWMIHQALDAIPFGNPRDEEALNAIVQQLVADLDGVILLRKEIWNNLFTDRDSAA